MVLNIKLLVAACLVLCSSLASAQAGTPNARPLLFGFALMCTTGTGSLCESGMRGRVGGAGRAGSTSTPASRGYPQVTAVAPGTAAERAGIRPGDLLQTIDGLSLLSTEGAERLAHAAAGQHVQLGFERDGKPISFSLELGPPSLAGSNSEKITGGYVSLQGGNVSMEVWSEEPVSLVADSASRSIAFQIGTKTIIRLKLAKDSTGTGGQRGGTGAKKPEPQWF